MSAAPRHGAIELEWGDGTHTFRLGLAEIEELEERCSRAAGRDVGIFTLARTLSPSREARTVYIREVLRLGLVGGGMTPVDALAMVRRYVDERPLEESRDAAYAVILAALARVHPGELGEAASDSGEPEGEADAAGPSGSTSPPSTPEPH